MTGQLSFDWDAAARKPEPVRRVSDLLVTTATPPPPAKIEFPFLPPRLPRKTLSRVVEKFFRDRGVPYVSVDDAKRALFASAKLASFHFVSYNKLGPNWLVWAAHLHKEAKIDMKEWEKVFGEGFLAVVAKQRANGELEFKTLEGKQVELS